MRRRCDTGRDLCIRVLIRVRLGLNRAFRKRNERPGADYETVIVARIASWPGSEQNST
jgi:hypothetical protein